MVVDKPNNEIIEKSAIAHLKNCFLKTLYVEPNISDNDKTPSWDGQLLVYNIKNVFEKGNILGVIPIQVKGSWQEDLSKQEIKFQVDIRDLINYRENGGVIFFVIYCLNFDMVKIYYNALLPFDIDRLIDRNNKVNVKTLSITFESFPQDDVNEIYRIFCDFIRDSKRQFQRDERIKSILDIPKLGIKDYELSLSFTKLRGESYKKTMQAILAHDTYTYLKPSNLNIFTPVEKCKIMKIYQKFNLPVIVNNELLYDKIGYEIDKEGQEIVSIGEHIQFNLNSNKFNFNINPMLFGRIKDYKILIALIKNEPIFPVSEKIVHFSLGKDVERLKNLQEELKRLIKVKATFDMLGVKEDLNLQNMLEADDIKLYYLVKSVYYNESVPLSFNKKEGFGLINISNLKIMVFCIKSLEENKFFISNYFDSNKYKVIAEDNLGNKLEISHYILGLNKTNMNYISNIDFESVYNSIILYANTDIQCNYINNFVLEILHSFDITKNKFDLLNLAERLIQFLFEKENIITETLWLNKLQIKKRKGALTPEDKGQLINIKNNTNDILIKLGAIILLENFDEAQMIFDKLPKKEQKIFNSFPIRNLWIS